MRPSNDSPKKRKTKRPFAPERAREIANPTLPYEEILRQMAENIHEIFWMFDATTFEAIYVSPAFEAICGVPRQSLYDAPTSYRQIIHPEDRDRILARLRKLPESGVFEEEYRIVRPDSQIRWVLTRGFLVRDSAGPVPLIVGTVQDITRRKDAEEALKRSEADYRSLFEGAPYGVFRATPDGCFLLVNSALVNMLGYRSQTDFLAVNLGRHIFMDPADHDGIFRECCRRERFENIEFRWKHLNGTLILVLASGRLVRADREDADYCEVMVEDITERRALEEQVRQGQKMDAIALLAGGTSHDFNTLLTGILGYAELLLIGSGLGESERRKVEGIVAAAVQARAITQQLLTLGRRQSLKPAVINVNGLIVDLEDFLRRMAGPTTQLLTGLGCDVGGVRVDVTQLTQVIMNLVANARDAMPDGGTLTITTSILELSQSTPDLAGIPLGHYVVLAISDTGCGMDDKIQARIFEPFFTTKPEGKGTGLGLAVVHGIVEQSGGYIRVSSRPREGTTFRILLPCMQDLVDSAQSRPTQVKTVSGCETILVVDDHDVARKLTLDFLSAHGYAVLVAKNGREAIQAAKKHPAAIHLLLTDVVMPKISGPELAKRLSAIHPETKVIYMTAYADVMDVARLGLGDQREVLTKPYMHHELMGKVRRVLGKIIAH